MGPRSRYLGPEAPKKDFLWQDPIPTPKGKKITESNITALKNKLLKSGLTNSQLIKTAWASASTFRSSDMRGGTNGARIQLAPQKDWESNEPAQLNKILNKIELIQKDFNKKSNTKISMADLIVLGGCAAIEDSAKKAGVKIKVPFTSYRADATQEQTDLESFAVLEPLADGFRNYVRDEYTKKAAELLIDKAQLLTLTAPEMTVLVGGMRALNTNYKNTKQGILTSKPGTLNNDFFINILDMNIEWKPSSNEGEYHGYELSTGKQKWIGSQVDLIFGSNSELRALSEVYAQNDSKLKFINDFVKAWVKVMNLDQF